jgi:hypothetical protein
MWIGQTAGQGWVQIGELGMAFLLSALIGLEREIRHKSAGLRTHTLVGFAAALIVLVSKYGFGDVIEANRVVLDPSRVAAQIVTGIGFIGGGLIFVRRDSVRGLTTAAIVADNCCWYGLRRGTSHSRYFCDCAALRHGLRVSACRGASPALQVDPVGLAGFLRGRQGDIACGAGGMHSTRFRYKSGAGWTAVVI